MRFLLDTNALSEPVRKQPSRKFMERMTRLAPHACTSVLCIGEMLFGARRPTNAAYEAYLAEVVLPNLPILEIDLETAVLYGELRARVERAGRPHSDIDLLIAATAINHSLTLVTRNRRDFEDFDELTVEDWTAEVRRFTPRKLRDPVALRRTSRPRS